MAVTLLSKDGCEPASDGPHGRGVDGDFRFRVGSGPDLLHVVAFFGGHCLGGARYRGLDEEPGQLGLAAD